jgi:hypothetical protein
MMSLPESIPDGPKPAALDARPFPVRLQFLHLTKLTFEAKDMPENLLDDEKKKAAPGFLRVVVNANVGDTRATVAWTLSFLFSEARPESGPPSQSNDAATPADSKRDYYSLEVRYTAGFVYDQEDITKHDVQQWCEKGSFYIVMPYMRSIVSEITSESGFPVVLLPLLKVPSFQPHPKKAATQNNSPESRDCPPR